MLIQIQLPPLASYTLSSALFQQHPSNGEKTLLTVQQTLCTPPQRDNSGPSTHAPHTASQALHTFPSSSHDPFPHYLPMGL